MVKNPPANADKHKRCRFDPGLGRSPGGGHSNPPQYSCLKNPMDRGAQQATVHRIVKSWTQLKQLSMLEHYILLSSILKFCTYSLDISSRSGFMPCVNNGHVWTCNQVSFLLLVTLLHESAPVRFLLSTSFSGGLHIIKSSSYVQLLGLPRWCQYKELAYQCRRH